MRKPDREAIIAVALVTAFFLACGLVMLYGARRYW